MAGQVRLTIADKEWLASVASTPWELAQGLGGIPELPQATGMLFDMGFDQTIHVTTVPMLFPLDIAFLSETLEVTEVYRNIQPGYLITSTLLARYFLEVNAGELDGVESGSQALFEFLAPVDVVAASDWVAPMISFMGLILMGIFVADMVTNKPIGAV
jgi:uncharacterized membrane protein (UPF0127 family)